MAVEPFRSTLAGMSTSSIGRDSNPQPSPVSLPHSPSSKIILLDISTLQVWHYFLIIQGIQLRHQCRKFYYNFYEPGFVQDVNQSKLPEVWWRHNVEFMNDFLCIWFWSVFQRRITRSHDSRKKERKIDKWFQFCWKNKWFYSFLQRATSPLCKLQRATFSQMNADDSVKLSDVMEYLKGANSHLVGLLNCRKKCRSWRRCANDCILQKAEN